MWMGSPSSPTSPATQRQQNPYLPSYLMGESSFCASTTPPAKPWAKATSPTARPLTRSTSNRSGYLNSSRTSFYEKEAESRSMRRRNGPPPVKTLDESFCSAVNPAAKRMDEVNCSDPNDSLGPLSTSGYLQRQQSRSGIFGNQSGSRDPSTFFNTSTISPSPAQLDPFYTQGESLNVGDELDETWVTVFGFPQSTESFVLQEFASFGIIVNHVTPVEGNWIHIQFQNKLQAKRAISKNGKVFGGKIMVGVTQCIDKSAMVSKKSNLRASSSTGNLLSTSQADNLLSPNSLQQSKKPTSIRPLTSAYLAAINDNQVIQQANVPQRSTGFVNKAMEYMFGW